MMKRILFVLLASILVLTSCSINVDDVIQRNIEARGGKSNIENMKTIIAEAKMSNMGMELPVKMTIKLPDKLHYSVSLMGTEIQTILNGKIGWLISDTLVREIPEGQITELQSSLKDQLLSFRNAFADKNSYSKVELLGKEKLDNKEVYKVKVVMKNGDEMIEYIDANNFLDVKFSAKRKAKTGEMMEIETAYSDFKKIGNYLIPHTYKVTSKGNVVSKVTFSKIEINSDIKDEVFNQPQKPITVMK